MRLKLAIFGLAAAALSCAAPKKAADPYLAKAFDLLKTTPIVDTHIDFPMFIAEHGLWQKPGFEARALSNPEGDFDLERAQKGGLSAPFMSIYIPAKHQKEPGRPREVADSLIAVVQAIATAYPDKFAIPKRAADVEANFKKGIVSLPMGMENGAPIATLADVARYHSLGVRYVTLAHSRDNHICDSSYDTTHTNGGLSAFGRELVREMNRVGIMVDVSHLDDRSIADVLAMSLRPVVATHSACRHFTPGFERNVTDEQIRQIAQRGGVVQVPFSVLFLNNDARRIMNQQVKPELEKRKLDVRTPEGVALVREFERKTGASLLMSASAVADQIDHIVKIAGVDAAGLGSDFDGVGPTLPPDLRDVSMYPNLIAELLRRGYSPADVRKICGGNLLRVWRACE